MFDLKKEDLTDDIDGILTVSDFYARAEGEGEGVQVLFI